MSDRSPRWRVLDWSNPRHWSARALPCRYCEAPTHLRDSKRSPAHKVCAEEALVVQAAEIAQAYRLPSAP